MKIRFYLFLFFALSLLLIGCNTALAADFDPSYIISDTELTDYNSMDQKDIENFLEKRNGTLENYVCFDKENNPKSAIQTFYEVSRNWMINPKYLLILVQKEQSLLEDPSPSQGQYDRATGYGCPDSGGCDDRWKGFYRQVNSAAAQTRYYMDHITEFGFQPGKTYTIDDKSVTIKNIATAGLYNYTPHLHGNEMVWNLWNKYFSKKWPDGSLLELEDDNTIYYIENGLKRQIVSKAVMTSRFDTSRVITVSASDLDLYEDGAPIKYLNFALLKAQSSGNIYMIVDSYKRRIVSNEVFKKVGFNDDDITVVPDGDLALYQDGADITEYTLFPTGTLMQNSKTKAIFYIISGQKKPVINKDILNANFSGLKITSTSTEALDKYPSGNPVTLPDGTLIKTKTVNTVYVISNGKRLPIFSGAIFKSMNYNSKNIKIVTQETLEVHPLGQTITGQW